MMKKVVLWLGMLLAFNLGTLPTFAHGYIIRSIPEDRATLERPPTRLQYWFSEALEPQFSGIVLRDENGAIVAEGSVDDNDDRLLRLQVPPALADGAYIVQLSPAFASDGHVVRESRVFFVGDEVAGVQGAAASAYGEPLEVLWKALLYGSTHLIFGMALLYAYVFVPVWGSTKHPAGLLPPRVMRRINWTIRAALILAILANMLALLQQTMIFFNVDAGTVFSGGLWQVVRIGSRSGDVFNVRMFFLLLIALAQLGAWYYREKRPIFVRSFMAAQVWISAVLVGAQAVNSHAAGALVLPWVAVAIHWLHTLAVAFWIGGIAALALVLPVALAPYTDETRWQALRPVMLRFSRYVTGAVAIVITSGIYSATNWFYTPADFATSYGASLAYKLLLVAGLLVVGGLHHVALRPHLLDSMPFKPLIERARNFSVTLRLEVLIVVAALAATSLLSATPIPEPDFLTKTISTPSAEVQTDNYSVQMTLLPGGPGVNTVDTVVRRGDAGVSDVEVALQFVAPERDLRGRWQTPDALAAGLFVAATDDIDEAGRWLTLVDIRAADGTIERAAFAWDISAEASVLQSVPPNVVHFAALLLVMAALLYTLYPALVRLATYLNWSPVTLLIALGGTGLSIVLIVGSILAVTQQLEAVNQQLNPPPQIVNPVLPDGASLARGQALYVQACANMATSADFGDLRRQLETMRDETLFDVTQEGWRDVPPCATDLDAMQRWDVVNFLRMLRIRA